MIYVLIYVLIACLVGCATYYYFCKEYKKSNSNLTLDRWLDMNDYYDVIAAMTVFWFITIPIFLIISSISFTGKLIRKFVGVD